MGAGWNAVSQSCLCQAPTKEMRLEDRRRNMCLILEMLARTLPAPILVTHNSLGSSCQAAQHTTKAEPGA
jgi:hypothetical protein